MNAEYEEWYRAEYGRVFAIVLAATAGDTRASEEAVAEAFLRAYERWDEVSQKDRPGAWVTRVAVNEVRSFRRWSRRLTPLVREEHRIPPHVDVTSYHQDLWERLEVLTPRQRKALVLRYVEDLSQRGVAEFLGVSEGTASATLSQARRKVRMSMIEEQE